MDKAQVIKVKYHGAMCRITAASSSNDVISLAALEGRIRASFKLSLADVISLTYADVDGDVIMLASDQDIVDALVHQQLNPLRVDLLVEKAPADVAPTPFPPAAPALSVASFTLSPASAGTPPASAAGAKSEPDSVPATQPDSAKEEKLRVEDSTELLEKHLRNILPVGAVEVFDQFAALLREDPSKIGAFIEATLKAPSSVALTPKDGVEDAGAKDAGAAPAAVHTPRVDVVNTEEKKETAAPVPAAAAATKPVPAPVPAGTCAATAAGGRSSVVHKGIICDGCEMNPLTGLRYKSLVRHDYDLCEGCFKKGGSRSGDFRCFESPVYRPRHSHRLVHASGRGRDSMGTAGHTAVRPAPRCGPVAASTFNAQTARPNAGDWKLEAHFVDDVTVPDSMEMLPGTHFTKVWRMRNTGGSPWPQGTRIVHIGGDALGIRTAQLLQTPAVGVLPDQEVDACVDMLAPSRPGRYMSHWRLCAPGGPKFGHRVWALINVVAPKEFRAAPAFAHPKPCANVAVPPAKAAPVAAPASPPVEEAASSSVPVPPPSSAEAAGWCAVLADVPPMPEPAECSSAEELEEVKPTEVKEGKDAANAEGYIEVPSALAPEVKDAAAETAPLAASPSVELTSVGNFSFLDGLSMMPSDPASDDCASSDGFVHAEVKDSVSGEKKDVDGVRTPLSAVVASIARSRMFVTEGEEEGKALEQLEGMGFIDRVFNEALRVAKGDVNGAVDVLTSSEWDSMLEELEDMGFEDKMLNLRMILKNGGDVKGAVKDIVQFYRTS